MRIRRVTYDLGNVIERQEYLDGRYGAPGEKRAKKKKATPEEVEQVNQWTRERKARHRLRMYFKTNDYFFTLTYPKEERPPDMKQAKQDFKEFYLFCKKEYKKRAPALPSEQERGNPDRNPPGTPPTHRHRKSIL